MQLELHTKPTEIALKCFKFVPTTFAIDYSSVAIT